MRNGLWVGIIEKLNIEPILKNFKSISFKNIWIVGWDQLITIFFKISRTSRALIVFSYGFPTFHHYLSQSQF
jgi:hypothetical protein